MKETKIQWCDSTLNMMAGCDGCELWNPKTGVEKCYAGKMTKIYAGSKNWPETFEKPALFTHRLEPILKWKDLRGVERISKEWIPKELPRTIFLDDMGDTFTESLPIDWLSPHLELMSQCKHIFIMLTKRPHRMADFFSRHKVPSNFWLCTSITNKASLGRIEHLIKIDAPILGLSIEPLWEDLDLSKVPGLNKINWVKIGGESGADATRCDLEWIRHAAADCKNAGAAVFIKQFGSNITDNGKPVVLQSYHGGDWDEWPDEFRIREMPNV